jgi:transcriptional regulator of acetoin/glycerol metabolism
VIQNVLRRMEADIQYLQARLSAGPRLCDQFKDNRRYSSITVDWEDEEINPVDQLLAHCILEAYWRNNCNLSAAARVLGMSWPRIQRQCKRLKIGHIIEKMEEDYKYEKT